MKYNCRILLLFLLPFLLYNCAPKERKQDVSTSEIKKVRDQSEFEILRYEKDVFALDLNDLSSGLETLTRKYYPELVADEVWNDPGMVQYITNYLQDPNVKEIYQEVEKQFSDITDFKNQLRRAFEYYLVYYPKATLPMVMTAVPGIDLNTPSAYLILGENNTLILHLDMYLGKDYANYGRFGMPKYISERCEKKFMVVDCFKKAMVYRHLPKMGANTLLDAMINEGKILYFTEMLLPETSGADIIGYNDEQMKWAQTFYGNMWNYMIEKGELYSESVDPQRRYIDEAPFTKPFGNEAPGRMGQYIGWQIVRDYMEKNPEITLSEMMQITDANTFLAGARFKPKPTM